MKDTVYKIIGILLIILGCFASYVPFFVFSFLCVVAGMLFILNDD